MANFQVGGLSLFSSTEGFVCDNMIEYHMVFPTGHYLRVTESERPNNIELLRGGGNNFGVLTHVVMKTMPLEKRWLGGVYNYSARQQFFSHINAMCRVLNRADLENELWHISLVFDIGADPEPYYHARLFCIKENTLKKLLWEFHVPNHVNEEFHRGLSADYAEHKGNFLEYPRNST